MNNTNEAGTAVVKDKHDVDSTNATNLSHLSLKTVVAQKALLQAMKKVRCVYNDDFRSWHRTYKLQEAEDLAENVELLLCDTLYNVRREQDFPNKSHNVINAMDVK